jgi:AraC family transcriptional regulator
MLSNMSEILAHVRASDGLAFQLRRDPMGVAEVPSLENVLLSGHLGAPSRVICRRCGEQFSGTAVHGDIDIIPAHTPIRWEVLGENDTATAQRHWRLRAESEDAALSVGGN